MQISSTFHRLSQEIEGHFLLNLQKLHTQSRADLCQLNLGQGWLVNQPLEC